MVVLVLVLSSLGIVGRFVRPVAAYRPIHYRNITHEGAIIVDNDETFTIEDSNFTIKGDIIVKDNARLIIRNTNLTITFDTYNEIYHPYSIRIWNKAMANITDSKVTLDLGVITLQNSSVIHVNNSTISEGPRKDFKTQLILRDNSVAYIQKSKIECSLFAHHNSIVYIDESNIRDLAPGEYSHEGNITVQVRDSYVDHMRAKYSNVHVWNSTIGSVMGKDSDICVEGSKIQSYLSAWGNSKIVLIYTYILDRKISAHDSSVVLVTLDFLPFVVLVPYQWVPWIYLGIVIAIIVSIGLIINFVRKRKIRRSLEKELGHRPLDSQTRNTNSRTILFIPLHKIVCDLRLMFLPKFS